MKFDKLKFSKLLNFAIGIIVLIFFFQLTLADQLSFSNDPIDHFFHYGQNYILAIIILLILIKIYFHLQTRWLKLITGLLSLTVVGIILILSLLFGGIVFSSERANMRHYFYEKNEYNYYLVSERFWAFEGSANLAYYKEKTLLWFVKHRLKVTEKELENEGIDLEKVTTIFYNKYFK